jgi:D-alanine transaminase
MDTVYLNGSFMPRSEAKISADDRGFIFGDGLYEVTPFYGGAPFRMQAHMERMGRGFRELRISAPPSGELEALQHELVARNALGDEAMSIVYLQVTRGIAPRTHTFPDPPVPPTVYAWAKAFQRPDADRWGKGFDAIRYPDRRWARADLKTVQLLPNVMAQQAAAEAGASDALFVRDGLALEGAQTNLFVVLDGVLTTHPASNQILHGISRAAVLEVARGLGMAVAERPIPVDELRRASEVFFTGTTAEVRPVVRIDGEPVGDGRVGPMARRLHAGFLETVARECGLHASV